MAGILINPLTAITAATVTHRVQYTSLRTISCHHFTVCLFRCTTMGPRNRVLTSTVINHFRYSIHSLHSTAILPAKPGCERARLSESVTITLDCSRRYLPHRGVRPRAAWMTRISPSRFTFPLHGMCLTETIAMERERMN